MATQSLRFQLYDTFQPGLTANAQSILFQVTQGADATHNQQFTNMRGPGALPQTENMVVDRIRVMQDKIVPKADLLLIWFNAILEIRIADYSVLVVPLLQCADSSDWGGSQVQAAPADSMLVGPKGQGYELDNKLVFPGAVPIKVILTQGAALSAPSQMKVIFDGIYTMQSQG